MKKTPPKQKFSLISSSPPSPADWENSTGKFEEHLEGGGEEARSNWGKNIT